MQSNRLNAIILPCSEFVQTVSETLIQLDDHWTESDDRNEAINSKVSEV